MLMWLSWCLQNGFVFVLDDRNWQLATECETKSTECYFLPLSSCSVTWMKESGLDKQFTRVADLANLDKSAKILYAGTNVNSWWPNHEVTRIHGIGFEHTCHFFQAALVYFWRLQPWLAEAISDNVRASLPSGFEPSRTVGMPVRASDKCKGHSIGGSAGGEMSCTSVEDLMKLPERIRRDIDPNVDTIIFTSEDPSYVEKVRQFNEALPEGQRWKMVFNVRDVMQGTGSASQVSKTRNTEQATKKKVIESALTSLHLQLRSRYLLMKYQTSWNICISLIFRQDTTTFAQDRHVISYDDRSSETRWTNFKC